MPSVMPIIIVSILLPIVLVAVIVGSLMRRQAATDQLLKTGIPARGRILQLGHTGGSVAVMGHRHLKLVLTCEVQPQAGMPYTASFEQLISELQLGSIQPGAMVELRIDPANPNKIALASVIAHGDQPGPNQWGAPGVGYGAAPMQIGVAQPNYRSSLPMILIIMFITTVPIGVIMIYTFGGFSSFPFGGSGKSDSGKGNTGGDNKASAVCEQAKKCCKAVSMADSPACDNYTSSSMPDSGCSAALDGYKKAAKSMGKTCE